MFRIMRKNRIQDELQLCSADGTVAESIAVDLNVDEIAARFSREYANLTEAQRALQNGPESTELIENFAKALNSVFNIVFGEDGCRKILDFYENHYTEMLLDLFPFLNDVVMPQIRKASAERKQQLLDAARATKRSQKGRKR